MGIRSFNSLGRRFWLGCPFFNVIGVPAVVILLLTSVYVITLTSREHTQEHTRSPSKVACSLPNTPPPVRLPAKFAGLSCPPKFHLGFLKTHRCGSSGVQNMLFRFAAYHELYPVVPAAGEQLSAAPFQAADVCDAPGRWLGYHMINLAIRWNHAQVRRVLPNDTTYFSIVREPVSQFLSMFHHLETDKFISIEQFAAQQPIPDERLGGTFGRNQQLWDFGLTADQLTDEQRIRAKVAEIEREFDLVMIAERMDESLVLLRHLLCWPTSYVVTMRLNALVTPRQLPASAPTRQRLQQWLSGDYILYRHFYNKFEERVKRFGAGRMQEEVKKLREETMAVVSRCKIVRSLPWKLPLPNRWQSDRVYGFYAQNSAKECQMFVTGEQSWLKLFRAAQKVLAANRNLTRGKQ